jgi:hypothetical protein
MSIVYSSLNETEPYCSHTVLALQMTKEKASTNDQLKRQKDSVIPTKSKQLLGMFNYCHHFMVAISSKTQCNIYVSFCCLHFVLRVYSESSLLWLVEMYN